MSATLPTAHGPRDFFYLPTTHGRLAVVLDKKDDHWLVRRWLEHTNRWTEPQKLYRPIAADIEQPSLAKTVVVRAIRMLPIDSK